MDGTRYPVGTFAEMARIPTEALPRFLAELPEMLEYARRVLAVSDALGAECQIPAVWIDDDKRTAEVKVTMGDEELMSAKFKMRPAQAMEARRAETGTGSVHDSAVPQECAQTPSGEPT